MIVTLNEIESLVLKAARGAGLPWGLAEEAAAAAVWLARADLLQIRPLLARLDATQGTSPPVVEDRTIRPALPGTALCPILTGAWIADQAITSQRVEVRNVLAPLLLSAVVARALPREFQLIVAWPDVRLVLGRAGLLEPACGCLSNMSAAAAASVSLAVRLHHTDAQSAPAPRTSGGAVCDADWQALQAFERCTYVPASEQSRLAGAGAGLLDGD